MFDVKVIEKIYVNYKKNLEEFKKYKKLVDTKEGDISKNSDLMMYYLGEMNRLQNSYFDRYCQFVIMTINNKEYLIDLKELHKFDISNLDEDLKKFIIDMLDKQDIYIGKIDYSDLPLIMAIKEEKEELPDFKGLSFEEREIRKYLYQKAITNYIKNELLRTKLCDSHDDKMPFVLNSDKQIKIWNEFDSKKQSLSEKEKILEYYKILLLFGNDIEEVYKEAPKDEKQEVIDAYYYFSTQTSEKEHFRTTSPIINEELLKRKYMKK